MPAVKPAFPRLFLSKPLAQGLVGAWPLYEGGGLSINDLSGQSNNGSLGTGVTWSSGQSGYALSFNAATTASVTLANAAANLQTPPFTWLAWVNVTSFAARRCVLASPNTASPELRINTSGFQEFVKPSVAILATSSTALTAGAYALVGLSYDGATAAFYLNGKPDGTTSVSQTFTVGTLQIGAQGLTIPFLGLMDGVLIWSRILSSLEVEAVYQDFFQIFRPSRTILKATVAVGQTFNAAWAKNNVRLPPASIGGIR